MDATSNSAVENNVSQETSKDNFLNSLTEPTEQSFNEPSVEAKPDMSIFEEQTSSTEENPTIKIDEKYKDLPEHEAIIRTLQSQRDKYQNQIDSLSTTLEQNSKYEEFYNSIMEDDDMLNSFIAERKPELLKKNQTDITEEIKTKLNTEFGDYKPTREEANDDPGGKAWLYYKRLDELYSELKEKKSSNKTIEELKTEYKNRKQKEQEELTTKLTDVKTKMNWDDFQLKSFYTWAQKLEPLTLAKMYRFALRTDRIPGASELQGGAVTVSERAKFLSTLK